MPASPSASSTARSRSSPRRAARRAGSAASWQRSARRWRTARGSASRPAAPSRAAGPSSTTRGTAPGSGATWRSAVIVRKRGTSGRSMRRGARVAAPLLPAAFALGASFGVLAKTAHMTAAAAVVMSATTFAGSSQVAAVSVLGAGGGAAAAVAAALLLNARYAPIGISIAQSFRGSVLQRFGESQLVVDESWALAGGGTQRFDRRVMLGVGAGLWVAWVGGTAVGALLGKIVGDTSAFGLDGAFAALFAALLAAQLRDRRRIAAAAAGAGIALALVPFTPAGVPIIAASAAVLVGWRRR